MKLPIFSLGLLFLMCSLHSTAMSQSKDSITIRVVEPSEAVVGNLQRIKKFPSKLITPRTVDVWLPESYSPQKKYAVLYMNDGQMLFDASKTWNQQEWGVDEHIDKLVNNKVIKETIVVGIWNVGFERNSDYFPQKVYNQLANEDVRALVKMLENQGNSKTIKSDNYLKFLVEELKPFIDENYATLSDYKNTSIMGSSRGGLISMYALCEYPQVFGAAACLSTHWIGTYTNIEKNQIPYAMFDYLSKHLPSPKTHKIYFDYGTKTLDALYLPYQEMVDTVLNLKGYGDSNFLNLRFEDADHSEKSWNKRLDTPLKFLLDTRYE